jgi:hypothetical protein
MDSNEDVWQCIASGTPGTWRLLVPFSAQANQMVRPGAHFLGDILHYIAATVEVTDEVQFIQLWLPAGITLTKMEIFPTQVGGAGHTIHLGIYDQADPTALAGVPNARVAQITPFTANTVTIDVYFQSTITSPAGGYIVPATGYYWLAFLGSGAAGPGTKIKPVLTATYVPKFTPIRFKAGQASLPASAGAVTTSGGALIYIAAVE